MRIIRSKLTTYKLKKVITHFVVDINASKTSLLTVINRNTINRFYHIFRKVIYEQQVRLFEEKLHKTTTKCEEAYFGGKRKGKKGRGAAGKSVILGLLERQVKVYTRVVSSLTAPALLDVIRSKTRKGSVFYTDTFKSYNSLKQFGKHHRINHAKALAYRGHNHINGIEGFWSYAKHKLYNYHGINRANFALYLKEMEYRFNHRNEDLTKPIIQLYFGYVSE